MDAADRQAIDAYWAEARPGGDYSKAPLAEDYLFVGPPMTLRGAAAHAQMSPVMTAMCFPRPAEIVHQYDDGGQFVTTILDWLPVGREQPMRLTVTQRVADGLLRDEYWAYDPRELGEGLVDRLRPVVEPLGGRVGLP